jgi:tRNA G18 (ribose-2'-O)-methylase SpoU
MEDTRNVIDGYKGQPMETIVRDLDTHGVSLEIAVENLARDFNMGTIVRSANAFGVRHIHIIGRRQWNKRGAMMTDKYLHLHYYPDIEAFFAAMVGRTVVAVDNVAGSRSLTETVFDDTTVLVFGSEGDGLSEVLLAGAHHIVAIEQFGSTRSLNVGVAAGVVMYEWVRRQVLTK